MSRPWTPVCVLALVGCPQDPDSDVETDSEADTDTDTDSDTDTNTPPVATAGDGSTSLVGDPVWLTATATDADGDTLTLNLTQTAGPTATWGPEDQGRWLFRPRQVGRYTFSVTASDAESTSDADTIDVVVHDLAGGNDHTVYLDPDGDLFTWGNGDGGETGVPTGGHRHAPGPVCDIGATDCDADPLTGIVAVSAGAEHTLALTSDGQVLAWGNNGNGQLGDASNDQRNTPVRVCDVGATDCTADPLTGVVAIAAGYWFSVALRDDGTVVTWGRGYDGELGQGTNAPVNTPGLVCASDTTAPCTSYLLDIVHIRAGGAGHALALSDNGTLWGWGHNKRGQTGNGDATVEDVITPQRVCAPDAEAPCTTFLEGVVEMDPWSGNSFAITASGELYGWGGANDNELGVVPEAYCNGALCAETPRHICATGDNPCTTLVGTVRDVAAGRRYSLARYPDGTVWGWGENWAGQLGRGDEANTSAAVQTCAPVATRGLPVCDDHLDGIAVIATGDYHSFAIADDGTLWGWGNDEVGQVGDGPDGPAHVLYPVRITGL